MSISFTPNGNASLIAANTASGSNRISITATKGATIGSFLVVNGDVANIAIVNIGFANTTSAVTPTGTANGTGFPILPFESKFLNLHQESNFNPNTTAYAAANTISGTANVVITPVYIYK